MPRIAAQNPPASALDATLTEEDESEDIAAHFPLVPRYPDEYPDPGL